MTTSGTSTAFRDLLFLTLLGFVAMVILLLPHLNPPADMSTAEDRAPGNIIVEITWPPELATDVDLWVRAPGDIPVGYSNKGGLYFNLLRDDLGSVGDKSGVNYEIAYTRGRPAGEYTVNVHLYRNTAAVYPIPVHVEIARKLSPKDRSVLLLVTDVKLTRQGQELTALRFKLDADGQIVPGSVNSLQQGLRSGLKGA